ncbi:uncharacterized protein HMPREF1541_11128 [Cyphellophora europaea CBS 101466]|uniref:Zn(2)-C6 fungal-type domain-containing protein n=1 Tax=Cyphellophora europaea (strain CBS 101466) TaxID=1220924 RepID=W2S798_CYPE1|nr:uncharacterized protein HMPREF1541_11128 [Cyphellophora europaea CBS 101466]ETN43804.1 hypothetical protein HMPREF1541_11128 [Cyphellophora europaea CBS 101466]
MKSSRYAVTRQKACQQCIRTKTKCDRLFGSKICKRCSQKAIECSYAGLPPSDRSHEADLTNVSLDAVHATSSVAVPDLEHDIAIETLPTASPAVGSASTALLCPIDADGIRNRWLNAYIPTPQQKPKNYPASISTLIHRILKAYTGMAIKGKALPPFIHFSQALATNMPSPLATCLSLVRMCDNPSAGSESSLMDVLQREMDKLYEWRGTCDHVFLLAAFQAYLLYSMIVFFHFSSGSSALLRQAMINIQELASATARQGLVCPEELGHARPVWESWCIAEAKRRTLYTMYLFDSLLSSQEGLPTFIGTELTGLPAPSARSLWYAQTRQTWEHAYNRALVEWPDVGLRIDELWPIPPDLDEAGINNRRSRVDRWLEDVDEYGTMMYAVTSCTHGG